MIATIFRIGYLNLKHGESEVVLTLTVPLIFLSIFALIFDNGIGGGATGKVKVLLVDEDDSDASRELMNSIGNDQSLRIMKGEKRTDTNDAVPLVDLALAEADVGNGLVKAAVVIPEGWEKSFEGDSESVAALKILSDSFDPVAKQIVFSVVKTHGLQVASKQKQLLIARKVNAGQSGNSVAVQTVRVRKPLNQFEDQLLPSSSDPEQPVSRQTDAMATRPESMLVDAPIDEVDLLGDSKKNPVLSSYAAGIVVVFVLFSATGFAGTLLDENETQTLERILNGRVTMSQLLAGKWLFIFCVGMLQVFCMFGWALFYGIDFTKNIEGFLLITIATVAAATSFAMVLATICKTRGQLNTVSMIVILSMSAMGGSMVPRYIMSETMQTIGKITFNAWALDGYNKVFWYGAPTSALMLELGILFSLAILLFLAARLLAIRWERVA